MATPALVEHCLELLSPLGAMRARRMFGGWGLYHDDLMIALIAFDRLYLKADEVTRERFAQAGCEPFVYPVKGKPVSMNYWTVPPEAMESAPEMQPWARLAVQAALAARAQAASPRRAHAPKPAAQRPARPR